MLWVYIFIVNLMTLTFFQSHRYVRNINCSVCFFLTNLFREHASIKYSKHSVIHSLIHAFIILLQVNLGVTRMCVNKQHVLECGQLRLSLIHI